MTGGGGVSQRRRKMNMGRGADGVCRTEEKPCPVCLSSVAVRAPPSVEIAEEPLNCEGIAPVQLPLESTSSSVDFFTQARKALCLRSPFDADDASAQTPPTSSSANVLSTTFLPSGLAHLLLKHSDGSSRKRHKRSHSGGEHKGRPEKSRGSNIWVETEEYFRELTVEDIDKLYEGSRLRFSGSEKYFTIPTLENSATFCNMWSTGNSGNADIGNLGNDDIDLDDHGCAVGGESKEGDDEEEGLKEENDPQYMDVDIIGEGNEGLKAEEMVKEEKGAKMENGVKGGIALNGFEWLLGSRSKIYLTSERPSKKRKLLGGDAGLEKLLVTRPVDGSSSLCHYCSTGDIEDQLNRLVVCSYCSVAVHQRCYGVQTDGDGIWLCSWCSKRKDGEGGERPCLLCPKLGGALKPAHKRDNQGSTVEFAHLFCCQWAPEVYVENIRTMEPIMNTGGINDCRRKLVCCLCKVKYGVCVRCSNGACRTAFHPLCAREARHRMEIWGRLGCDEVELRAFCAKHSEGENVTSSQCTGDVLPIDSDSKEQAIITSDNKIHKLKICRRIEDKITVNVERKDLNVDADKINDEILHADGLLENMSDSKLQSDFVNVEQHVGTEAAETDASEDSKSSVSLNFNMILKKLIDQGEVELKDLAEDFGLSPDSLSPQLMDSFVFPNLNGKVETWLKDHGYISSVHKPLKVKIKSATSLKAEDHVAAPLETETAIVAGTDSPQVVPVKCVPPRRRTKNDQILRNEKVICASNEMISDDMDDYANGLPNGDGCSSKVSSYAFEKNLNEASEFHDISALNLQKSEAEPSVAVASSIPGDDGQKSDCISEKSDGVLFADLEKAKLSSVCNHFPILKKADCSYTQPLVQCKLIGMDNGFEYDGSRGREFSQLGASSSSGICCNRHSQQMVATDWISKHNGVNLEQLVKARNMGVLQWSPSDEVEGELIYYQHKLMSNADRRKCFMDDLISKVAKNLQQEIDSARKQKWDAVLLSQYLYELREAKKQGRKERRHKEAQAVLAAATAAAAASSRISSLRKDAIDESAHVEELPKSNFSNGRPGLYSQQNPRVKETISRSAASRLSSEKNSDLFSLASDFSVEHPRTCDICGRCETMLHSILVCSSCKVAVHLDCYRGVKCSTGPWYCELCDDLLSSRGAGFPSTNTWDKPYVIAECGLCGGTAGAFRKSIDGQWIHAFCAEWVLESTFRRGQVNPIDVMEVVSKGSDVCVVCSRRQGVCIKCSYGNCQSTFHASCARSTGFYMNVRTNGGKLQHKAYCGKHSIEQKAKAETQKHGTEEFKSLKQVRVELERLRLLCERIIKREKLKRELVLCAHDILASNKDTAVLSALSRHPFYQPDLSSESATTSTRGYTDGKSGSDTIQRSDDITVDSTVAGKRRIKLPMAMDGQKTDDSSVSQHLMTQKPNERMIFSGKQVPHRSVVSSRNLTEDAEKRSRFRKHPETFEKELVMTSDQASVKNQRLPKGFVYVPIRCLSKEKETRADACSEEPLENDGWPIGSEELARCIFTGSQVGPGCKVLNIEICGSGWDLHGIHFCNEDADSHSFGEL